MILFSRPDAACARKLHRRVDPKRQTSFDFENNLTRVFFHQNANLYQVTEKLENVAFFLTHYFTLLAFFLTPYFTFTNNYSYLFYEFLF